MISSFSRRAAALAVALALAGCGTFRNDVALGVPAAQRAVLVYKGPSAGVTVIEVDGQDRGIGLYDRYELAPGLRTVGVMLNVPGLQSDPLALEFHAVPAREYELRYEVKPGRTAFGLGTWRIWVEDTVSGETVSRPIPRKRK